LNFWSPKELLCSTLLFYGWPKGPCIQSCPFLKLSLNQPPYRLDQFVNECLLTRTIQLEALFFMFRQSLSVQPSFRVDHAYHHGDLRCNAVLPSSTFPATRCSGVNSNRGNASTDLEGWTRRGAVRTTTERQTLC
jgi:hypothetical protein